MASKSKMNRNNSIISPKMYLGFVMLGIFVLYLVYSWVSSISITRRSNSSFRTFSGWRTSDLIDIPNDILEKAKSIKIDERHLTFEFNGQKHETFFLEVRGDSNKKPPVLLLHGAGSSSDVWKKIGTLGLLGALGNRVVAMNLPGSRGSSDINVSEEMAGGFLAKFIEMEQLGQPVILAASMSGRYAIPYIMNPEPSTCLERARAFIPLAPTSTAQFTHAEYHRCEMPVLITYGEKDKILGLQSTGNLRNMPNSEIFPMAGAGHVHYEDKTMEWHRLVYNFMVAVNKDRI